MAAPANGMDAPKFTYGLLYRLARFFRRWAASMIDALPPYKRVEGLLTDKGADARGNYHILVDGEIIGVDWLTYETLIVGEPLRIRATRANQAINIDRLSP